MEGLKIRKVVLGTDRSIIYESEIPRWREILEFIDLLAHVKIFRSFSLIPIWTFQSTKDKDKGEKKKPLQNISMDIDRLRDWCLNPTICYYTLAYFKYMSVPNLVVDALPTREIRSSRHRPCGHYFPGRHG